MILKRSDSCDAKIEQRFGLTKEDMSKDNILVWLIEAKGAVEALKLCIGPELPVVKGTLHAEFPGCRFYSSDVDGWENDFSLISTPLENERTLMVVLPHVLSAGDTAAVFDELEELGFQTIARKRTKLTAQAVRFI